MKKAISLSIMCLSLFILASCQGGASKEEAPVAADSTHKDSAKVTYTCPMDTEVVSDTAGACPKCGMDLEEATTTAVK